MDDPETKLSGRRIVDVNYLIRQLIVASKHGDRDCGLKDMYFIQEKRTGLKSTLHYKCRTCFLDFDIKTEFEKPIEMDINALVSIGACKSGAEFSTVETIFTSANIPFMSPSEFCAAEPNLVNGSETGNNPGYCVYCGNKFVKLISHMALHHKEKKEVKRLLSLQHKNDPMYSVLLRALCQKGESLYSDQNSPQICQSCNLSFSVLKFPSHNASCPLSKSDGFITIVDMMDVQNLDQPLKLANFQDDVVTKLNLKDAACDHIFMDPILVGYSIDAMEQNDGEDSKQVLSTLENVVPTFLRMAQKSVDIKSVVDVFDISQWDTFIDVIYDFAHENSSEDYTDLMIGELGRYYFHLATFVVSKCRAFSLETDRYESWMGFYRCYYSKPKQMNWAIMTNRLVHFIRRLSDEICCLIEALTDGSSDPQVFEALNVAAIMKIVSCNKRTFVPINDMLISEFNQRLPISSNNADVWSAISESEKFMSHNYEYVHVCSQFGRTDAILLDASDVRAIKTILSCRRKFGVSQKNVFVFGRENSLSYEQSAAVDKFVQRNPHLEPLFISLCPEMKWFVSSTAQAVAMGSSVYSLKKSLGFFGCSRDAAGEVLTEVLDRAKLSRLTCALNQGRFDEFKGIKFCNVPINTEVVTYDSTDAQLATTVLNESAANARFECPLLTFDSFVNEDECSPPKVDSSDMDQSLEFLLKKARRVQWTKEEREALLEFFGPDIFTLEKLPSYKLCESAIIKYRCLRKRTKAQVKAYINNEQKKFKKTHEEPT